jgi:TRAP-type mannitol/chloroaromatic compound transport system permease small subunit
MLQESEYWLHSFLIVLVVGYAYTKQSHVRIDLIRESLSERAKHLIEITGILLALIPYSFLGAWLSWPYVVRSYTSGEISKSQTGLTDLWILKSGLIILFVLIGLAGISQLIKSIAGLAGKLPENLKPTTIVGGR